MPKPLTFAEKIKTFRRERGYSQSELAEIIGVTQSHLSKYERGDRVPGMKTAGKLEKLGVRCLCPLCGNFFAGGENK